jgi:hypothetical protein
MIRTFYAFVFCLLTGIQILPAQNQADSLKVANEKLKIQNDSLKMAQQKADEARQTAPQQKNKDSRPFIKRLSFDISTSFWINPSSVYFEFSPMVMYHFPKTYSLGTGPAYVYRKDLDNKVSLNGLGGKVFARANFTNWLYGWTEYQGINNQHITNIDNNGKVTKDNEYVDSFFLSLGINIRLGKRHAFNAQALYDVMYKESTSVYYSPWTYRIGFGF